MNHDPLESPGKDASAAAVGLAVVAASWTAELLFAGLSPTPGALLQLHLAHPALWLVDLTPLVTVWAFRQVRSARRAAVEHHDLRERLEAIAGRADATDLAAAVFDGLLVVDPDGRVAACNPAAEQIFGYSAAELTGKPVTELLLGLGENTEDRRRPRRTSRAVVLAQEYALQGQHRHGARFPVTVTMAPFDTRAGKGTLYAVRDVGVQVAQAKTELRMAVDPSVFEKPAAATGSSASDGRVLAGIAERIRPMLATVLGHAAPGKSGEPDAERVRAEGMGHEVLLLLGNLVDARALATKDLDLHVESVPVASLVREAVDATQWITRGAGNWVDTTVPEDASTTCEVDQRRARDILVNLIARASAASKASRIAVRAWREEDEQGAYHVVFEVEDPGATISRLDLKEAESKPDPESPFLGLQLAQAIAEEMGGMLTINSLADQGTTARLVVPSNDRPSLVPARGRVWKPAPRPTSDRRERDAYLIGATPVGVAIVRDALEDHHWQVVEVDYDDALARVRDDRPKLLVFGFRDPVKTWNVWLELKRHPVLGLIPAMCIDDGTHARRAWQTRLVSTPADPAAVAALAAHLFAARIVPRALVVERDPARRDQLAAHLRSAGWWVHGPPDAAAALALAADLPPELLVLGRDIGGELTEVLASFRGTPATKDVPVISTPGRLLATDEAAAVERAGCTVLGPEESDDMLVVFATIALAAHEDQAGA